MSEPKRWELWEVIMEDTNSEWVRYEDYARLKAEVERLRNAGDELSIALAAFHLIHRGKIDTTTQPDIVAWNAAKEGKQS